MTDVALIPLTSQSQASTAIDQAKQSLSKRSGISSGVVEYSDTSDDEEISTVGKGEGDEQCSPTSSDPKEDFPNKRPEGPERSTSKVAQEIIGNRGHYGRFAERWFSKKGWSTEKRRAQGSKTAFLIIACFSSLLVLPETAPLENANCLSYPPLRSA